MRWPTIQPRGNRFEEFAIADGEDAFWAGKTLEPPKKHSDSDVQANYERLWLIGWNLAKAGSEEPIDPDIPF